MAGRMPHLWAPARPVGFRQAPHPPRSAERMAVRSCRLYQTLCLLRCRRHACHGESSPGRSAASRCDHHDRLAAQAQARSSCAPHGGTRVQTHLRQVFTPLHPFCGNGARQSQKASIRTAQLHAHKYGREVISVTNDLIVGSPCKDSQGELQRSTGRHRHEHPGHVGLGEPPSRRPPRPI